MFSSPGRPDKTFFIAVAGRGNRRSRGIGRRRTALHRTRPRRAPRRADAASPQPLNPISHRTAPRPRPPLQPPPTPSNAVLSVARRVAQGSQPPARTRRYDQRPRPLASRRGTRSAERPRSRRNGDDLRIDAPLRSLERHLAQDSGDRPVRRPALRAGRHETEGRRRPRDCFRRVRRSGICRRFTARCRLHPQQSGWHSGRLHFWHHRSDHHGKSRRRGRDQPDPARGREDARRTASSITPR